MTKERYTVHSSQYCCCFCFDFLAAAPLIVCFPPFLPSPCVLTVCLLCCFGLIFLYYFSCLDLLYNSTPACPHRSLHLRSSSNVRLLGIALPCPFAQSRRPHSLSLRPRSAWRPNPKPLQSRTFLVPCPPAPSQPTLRRQAQGRKKGGC